MSVTVVLVLMLFDPLFHPYPARTQVCLLCETDRCHYVRSEIRRPSSFLCCQSDDSGFKTTSRIATGHRVTVSSSSPAKSSTDDGLGEEEQRIREGEGQVCVGSGGGGGSWLSCLRQLYAAVPTGYLSTVELVLEQTLHQMPDISESLLDAIEDTDSKVKSGITAYSTTEVAEKMKKSPPSSREGFSRAAGAPLVNDLGLLLLLLREASPLRACSLPLLPNGMDRSRRAEECVRGLILLAARRGSEGQREGAATIGGKLSHLAISGGLSERLGCEGALDGARALLRGVLCSECAAGMGENGSRHRGINCELSGWTGGGSGSSGVVGVEGREVSGIASERASQLLELALRWLDEGGGEGGTGGSAGGGGTSDGAAVGGNDGNGTVLTMADIASEVISAIFDTVEGARPRLLRALLTGVFDQSKGGAACAWSYLRAWEALMAQESKYHVSF